MLDARSLSQADAAEPCGADWSPLEATDPRASQSAAWEQAINVELTLFRHSLPADDKRCFFRSAAEAQEVVDRAAKALPAGIRARVASIHAVRADQEREAADTGAVCLYFRVWGLLVGFQKAGWSVSANPRV
jgi:hypothetical protein